MQLIDQTKMLLQECDASINRYNQMRENDASPHFFEEVKPYVDDIQKILNEWQLNANQWIEKNQPKYLHDKQIDNVVEAMNQFIVQSFYKETSKKRFVMSVQSVRYTLSTFLRYIEEGRDVK